MEERPFRIREVEGSNPSVSITFFTNASASGMKCWHLSVAQLVEHVTVDVCDHRVAGSIPAAESLRFTSGRQNAVDDEGFEPSTFRMQNGRSTTELNALGYDPSAGPHSSAPPTGGLTNS